MIEQGLHTVQRPGKPATPSFPNPEDKVSAFETVEARRKGSKTAAESNAPKFQIQKQFTTSSKELARTLGSFHKILERLEEQPSESDDQPQIKQFGGLQAELFKGAGSRFDSDQLIGPQPLGRGADGGSNIAAGQQNASPEIQLELDLFPRDGAASLNPRQSASPEIKDFDIEIPRATPIEQPLDIKLGNNPTNFKIQNIITDEIIKAIANSNSQIDVKPISEPVAVRLANEVRQLLEKQPHALATTKESAPVKALDRAI